MLCDRDTVGDLVGGPWDGVALVGSTFLSGLTFSLDGVLDCSGRWVRVDLVGDVPDDPGPGPGVPDLLAGLEKLPCFSLIDLVKAISKILLTC